MNEPAPGSEQEVAPGLVSFLTARDLDVLDGAFARLDELTRADRSAIADVLGR